jgi:ketosteroid isomerase-like protein
MDRDEQVIHQIYDAFNARDMQGVFALLTDDVAWANGMEGTHIHGKDAIRDYWTHQWSVIDPHVEPLKIARAADGSVVVDLCAVRLTCAGRGAGARWSATRPIAAGPP